METVDGVSLIFGNYTEIEIRNESVERECAVSIVGSTRESEKSSGAWMGARGTDDGEAGDALANLVQSQFAIRAARRVLYVDFGTKS